MNTYVPGAQGAPMTGDLGWIGALADWIGSHAGKRVEMGPNGPMVIGAPQSGEAPMGGSGFDLSAMSPSASMGGVTPQEPPPGASLALAKLRVQRGDLGSPSSPLTLSGSSGLPANSAVAMPPPEGRPDSNLPPEQQQFAPESKAWREAQSDKLNAALNRQKADRIWNYLSHPGDELRSNPELADTLKQQATRLDALAQVYQKRLDAKQALQDQLSTDAFKAIQTYKAAVAKSNATDERMSQHEKDTHFRQMWGVYQRMHEAVAQGRVKDEDQARKDMAHVYAEMIQNQTGDQVSIPQAMIFMDLENGDITEDEARQQLADLQGGQ